MDGVLSQMVRGLFAYIVRVTLGKSFNLSDLQFPHLEEEDNNNYLIGLVM